MYQGVRKDVLIIQAFKREFENSTAIIEFEIKSNRKNLANENYHKDLVDKSLDSKFESPKILFENKEKDSPDEYTIITKIPVTNPEVFEKLYSIVLNHDKSLNKSSIQMEFKKGQIIFIGKTNVILANNPQMIEDFKKTVEKNISIFETYIEEYSNIYEGVKDSSFYPYAKLRIDEELKKTKNISKNKDSLDNW